METCFTVLVVHPIHCGNELRVFGIEDEAGARNVFVGTRHCGRVFSLAEFSGLLTEALSEGADHGEC
jgi:hypothetical protein